MLSDIAQQWSERAAIMQYDGGLSRDRAEIAAYVRLIRNHPALKHEPMSRVIEQLRRWENAQRKTSTK